MLLRGWDSGGMLHTLHEEQDNEIISLKKYRFLSFTCFASEHRLIQTRQMSGVLLCDGFKLEKLQGLTLNEG